MSTLEWIGVVLAFGFGLVVYYLHYITHQLAEHSKLLNSIADLVYRQTHPALDDD